MNTDDLFVFAAAYDDEADALSDLETFFDLALVGACRKIRHRDINQRRGR